GSQSTATTNKRLSTSSLAVRALGECDEFSPAMDARGSADRGATDHYSLDPPTAFPIDRLGCDEVSAGGQPDVARLCANSTMADSRASRPGDRGTRVLNQPPARDRLARPRGWRPTGYDSRPHRPLTEHDATGREFGQLETQDRRRAVSSNAGHTRL